MNSIGPLSGLRVVDFTTLLPGPLATLILAEAGAEVVKIERPGVGDEMRTYEPRFGSTSINFALLNRGKRSICGDLKDSTILGQVVEFVRTADILVEQFRPGTMARLGLSYEELAEVNPQLIYCSISGYGPDGPKATKVAHDLNYVAETGLLDLVRNADDAPSLPHVLIADIAGGAYPAVMSILLALFDRQRTGSGTHLEISMANSLFTLMYWAVGNGAGSQLWPRPGRELVTGGSPRYHLYQAGDGAWLAVAALEQRFWERLCHLVDLPAELWDDSGNPSATLLGLSERFRAKPAATWAARFENEDVCVSVVVPLEMAVRDPQFAPWFEVAGEVVDGDRSMPALPLPLAGDWLQRRSLEAPRLGQDNGQLELNVDGS